MDNVGVAGSSPSSAVPLRLRDGALDPRREPGRDPGLDRDGGLDIRWAKGVELSTGKVADPIIGVPGTLPPPPLIGVPIPLATPLAIPLALNLLFSGSTNSQYTAIPLALTAILLATFCTFLQSRGANRV